MKLELPEIVEPQTAYVANMRALWAHAPSLAVAIDRVDERSLVEYEPARSGALTCRVAGAKGEGVYVHSRYDPQKEASRWADGAVKQAQQQRYGENGTAAMCYFVDGFGLGYHVKALFDRLAGEAFVVVSESDLALLRTALEEIDYAEMLASDRLIFITQADRGEIFQKLQNYSSQMMMGMVFTRRLPGLASEDHGAVHQLVSEYASYLRSHMVSLLANSIVTCRNVLCNLPTYVATPGVGVLAKRFAGCPAVVVSAGPSLRRNIELLKEIREQVVVIAVQTTLKPLLNYGIRPDFVTSLDYHEVSGRFFEGIEEDLSSVHLVAEPKATWQVVDRYRKLGPISLLGNEFARLVLGREGDGHDELPAGATVAHLAFYLAEYMGADPIIFVGQDLAFSDNVYYSPGTVLHEVWEPELNRFCTLEMKEWERIVRNRGILRQVEDIHGQRIYTDEQMFTYLQQFEKDFAKCTSRIIDATEGGAKKRGCETMTLAEAVERYGRGPIGRERFGYREKMKAFDKGQLAEALERVRKRIADVEELGTIAAETAELVTEMLGLVEDQEALNRRMNRLDELRAKVKQRGDTYRLVMHVSQSAEMFRFRQDRILEMDSVEGKERQRRQLQRDVGYVSAIRKGCERLGGLMRESVERFEEEMEEKSICHE